MTFSPRLTVWLIDRNTSSTLSQGLHHGDEGCLGRSTPNSDDAHACNIVESQPKSGLTIWGCVFGEGGAVKLEIVDFFVQNLDQIFWSNLSQFKYIFKKRNFIQWYLYSPFGPLAASAPGEHGDIGVTSCDAMPVFLILDAKLCLLSLFADPKILK